MVCFHVLALSTFGHVVLDTMRQPFALEILTALILESHRHPRIYIIDSSVGEFLAVLTFVRDPVYYRYTGISHIIHLHSF
jgi:hypothetical protein